MNPLGCFTFSLVFSNLSMDTLDYSGPKVNEGSKGIWLGVGEKLRDLPTSFSAGAVPQGVTDVQVFCPGCLVIGGPPKQEQPDFVQRIAKDPAFADWPLLVVTDEPKRAAASAINFLWTTFTRFEPGADIYAAETTVERHHLCYRGPLAIDARLAAHFPDELFCDEPTSKTVDKRWKEYFPNGMEMGDSSRGHLD